MERLQGPIDPCYFGLGEHFNVELLERGGALGLTHDPSIDLENLRCEEERLLFSTLTQHSDEKMSFVQMLRGVESSSFIDPNFQFLLRLQQQQQNQKKQETYFRNQVLELESCTSNEILEAQSSIQSESKDPPSPQSSSCPEVEMEVLVSSAYKVETNSPEKCREWKAASSSRWGVEQNCRRAKGKPPQSKKARPAGSSREKRKRKRTRPSKNKEEVESQRLTHIAVEHNRRRQMNNHLNALRSLMPTSFIQRGDQASIITGAIVFVNELEQLLQSLEAQKKMSKSESESNRHHSKESAIPVNWFFASPQYTIDSSSSPTVHLSVAGSCVGDEAKQVNEYVEEEEEGRGGDEGGGEKLKKVENKAAVADIEVIVIKTHVKLKIVSERRRAGELVKAIAALGDLRLNILHLNITSSRRSVLYSFNLKMEEECKLGSADDIATAVHQTFSVIDPA